MTSTIAPNSGRRRARQPLFNRPQWATPAATEEEQDIFTRGKRDYVPETATRAERKSTELLEPEHPVQPVESEDERQGKKRRISSDTGRDASHDEEPPAITVAAKASPKEINNGQEAPNSPGQETSKSQAKASPSVGTQESNVKAREGPSLRTHDSPTNVINLDSDEGSGACVKEVKATQNSHSTRTEAPASPPHTESTSPEEQFPELARKARELSRQRQEQRARAADAAATGGPPPPEAPAIRLQIRSAIPGTRPLEALRKVDQRLRIARQAWCAHAGLSEADAAGVILVWRDVRVYDSASPRSLGLGVDADGDITRHGRKEEGSARQRVALEAMTLAVFEERQRQRRAREEAGSDADEAAEAAKPPPKPEEPRVRLVVQAKGLPELKVILPLHTPMYRIARAFRVQSKLPADKQISLFFDGERLDDKTVIQDTEIADMDMLEAIVR